MKPHSTRFMLLALAAAGLGMPAAIANAGDLEPPGPPAPTMKTLDEVPGSWHRLLDSTNGDVNGCNSDRFKCVMNNEAVLDVETGLVWQKTPSAFNNHNQSAAELACIAQTSTGGRNGWRLPSTPEISSLRVDNPTEYLPTGHPFIGINNATFWTSNTDQSWNGSGFDLLAWVVAIRDEYQTGLGPAVLRSQAFLDRAWCVRGPSPSEGPGN